MTDEERIDDAYERIDIDTDEILLAFCDACDGERVERYMKSIWDSTVTMHQIATVALKENTKLRELLEAILQCAGETKRDKGCDACPMFNGDEAGAYLNKKWCLLRPTMRELGIEVR